MQTFNISIMLQLRILSIIFFSYISLSKLMGQEVKAVLQNTFISEDSLTITLFLKNTSSKSIYLVCPADVLIFDDYMPDRVNYGDFRSETQTKTIVKQGCVKDTIELVIPITEERFQEDFKGNEIDVFKTLTNLQNVSNNKKASVAVPLPPDDSTYFLNDFLDLDLYELIQEIGIVYDKDNSSFFEQTIILKPNEEKSFDIDLSYLLLRKATYKIFFDYKTDNKLFKKETEFLKQYGFFRYKGRIVSNVISIVSE